MMARAGGLHDGSVSNSSPIHDVELIVDSSLCVPH